MRKYNYFDDDDAVDEIAPPAPALRDKSEEPSPSADDKPAPAAKKEAPDKAEILEALKAFSHKSGEKIKTVAHTALEKNPVEELDKLGEIKKSKRVTITIGMLLLVVLIFASMIGIFMHSINKENARIHEFNQQAGQVCSDYITKYGNASYENLYDDYGVKGYRLTGLCFAREVDFDNDGSSELLLCYNKNGTYYNEVWGENADKNFALLFSEKAAQTNSKKDDAWVTIYHKNHKYYVGVHSESDLAKVDLYTLKGDKFEKKLSCEYEPSTQEFIVNKKADDVSFERVKLSVLRAEKAIVSAELAANTIDSFLGTSEATTAPADGSKNLKDAYYSIVQEYNQRYGTASYVEDNGVAHLGGLAVVDLVDFDGDGTDELFLVYRKSVKYRDEDRQGNYIAKTEDKYYCEIYRYNGKKAILAYESEGLSSMLNDSTSVYYILRYKNNKCYYCINRFSSSNYGRVVSASSTALKFTGTEFKQHYKAAYKTDYGYTEYYLNDESVYKSTFNNEGYKIPLFNGETDGYDDNMYKVTFVQRKLLSAGDMSKQVDKTVANIQKLNSSYSGDAN